MTSEEYVRTKYPRAKVQHYATNNPFDTKGYYLCWSDFRCTKRLSEGKTKSNAWVNAKKNILKYDKERSKCEDVIK